MKVRNYQELSSHGDVEPRKTVLELMEATLEALDAYPLIKHLLKLEGDILRIGDSRWDLRQKRHVFVVGAGKACNAMARAVEEILGDRIEKGIVIVKQKEPGDELYRIELVKGGHPLPGRDGFQGTQRILSLVDESHPDDLFIGLISGGSSALMSCPVPGISLDDEIQVTDQLLKSGARILEINAVRRHISQTNGGRLAERIEARGAEMINLIISDSVGDKPTLHPEKPALFFGTPVAPDGTTVQDARKVLRKYALLSRAPRSIIEFLQVEAPSRETPKRFGQRIHQFVLEGCADSCEVAKKIIKEKGQAGLVLTTFLEGESREAGTFLASVVREILFNRRPLVPPCFVMASGETTTKVEGSSGRGGPSQELALSFALEAWRLTGTVLIAMDTDGTDGSTDVAGGIVDSATVERARQMGLDPIGYLYGHDSATFLQHLGDQVLTGNTGTNVCDFNVMYIRGNR